MLKKIIANMNRKMWTGDSKSDCEVLALLESVSSTIHMSTRKIKSQTGNSCMIMTTVTIKLDLSPLKLFGKLR